MSSKDDSILVELEVHGGAFQVNNSLVIHEDGIALVSRGEYRAEVRIPDVEMIKIRELLNNCQFYRGLMAKFFSFLGPKSELLHYQMRHKNGTIGAYGDVDGYEKDLLMILDKILASR